ncbi:histidine kinase dimerization/phosphoacceptor domain -containing protein [Fodinibius saliphilus]|uniref:histidine kinase dimerization/phosphoacceptor domain -containing protein n=1 Tax=Fodinibius saliphilus TaxID=1920650 RepID=UPI001107B899|nr:histidine kinase dimerization/phosphoacceptor domain -containing protein [Fodinibius saliphilus]
MSDQEAQRGYYWQPVTFELLLSNYSLSDGRLWGILSGWILAVIATLAATVFLLPEEWLLLEGSRNKIVQFFLFNPALILGMLLFFWFGFEWGFIPIFLCSFIIAFYSGMAWGWALIFGIAFVFGLAICATAYRAFGISHDLRSFKSMVFFISISFIGSIGSSLGAFIWSFSHRLSAFDTLVIWKGWWSGSFLQALLIIGPLLWIGTPAVERLKRKWFEFTEDQGVSLKWIIGAVASITGALSLFIFSGKFLGEMRVQEVMESQKSATVIDVVNALESFEIISWISIGIIVLTGYGAFKLISGWNRRLTREVKVRTEELNESQEKLKVSLEEKELLLREIHHRVKNNMALVSALLELQQIKSGDQATLANFRTVRSRIKSMAMAHEVLYENESLSNISMKSYVERVGKLTHQSFGGGATNVELKTDIEDTNLDMAYSIPLGLFINETLINAYKHAFDGKDKGCIWLESVIKDGKVNFVIRDNGVGLPDELNEIKKNSLGISLIKKFAKQLKADLTVETNEGEGTKYSLVFSVD